MNFKQFRSVLYIVAIGFFLYKYATILFVFNSISSYKSKQYNQSFNYNYIVNDYNDSRIKFYKKGLEKFSEKFIEARGMYDIFEADTKIELSLKCIEHFLRENNDSNFIETTSAFRKKARNKYANTDDKILKFKINQKYLDKHFYDYEFNEVNSIIGKTVNKKICQEKMPIDKIYKDFISKYIYNRENALIKDKKDFKSAPYIGTLTKSFYKRNIKITEKWLRLLYSNNLNYDSKKVR